MKRSKTSSPNTPGPGGKLGLAVTTALASVMLTGCTTATAPPATTSFGKAQIALEKGQADRAIAYAEEAVLAEPRNPSYRAMLGAAYLEAGRFESAATTFDDALALGDEDPRTVLSYALAKIGQGDNQAALARLTAWEGAINPADLGLAFALAGNPERGIHVLTNTLRAGHNTPKVRQNLAYTYALAGNWRAARLMMAEDVPPGEIDARLTQWAANAAPEHFQVRVASLLNVTPSQDGGQPRHLALGNFPSQQMMVAQAQSQAPAELAFVEASPTRSREVESVDSPGFLLSEGPQVAPPVRVAASEDADVRPAKTVEPRVAASKSPASTVPAFVPTLRFVSRPVVQDIPEKVSAPARQKSPQRAAAAPKPRAVPIAKGAAATHLVQLGSFDSRAVAEDKANQMKRQFVQLRDRDVVITEAEVGGRTFFRLAVAGFEKSSARSMCSIVQSKGSGCFAYAAASPPAGAINRAVRVASR